MTVDERTREALLATYLHPLALCDRWLTRRGAASALDQELGRLDDDDWNTRYHGAIGIGTPADYRHRLVETRHGAVLCSIHFYNGERDKPFVELIARTSGAVTWEEAARAAVDAHAVFAPTRVRFMHVGGEPPEAGAGWSPAPDQRLVLGEARAMRRAPADAWDDRLTLERASVDDAEEAMDEAYAHFARRSPDLAPCVPPATRTQLERCDADGLLRFWLVDGERAGLLGVVRESYMGIDTTLVMEECATPAWTGRGTAACAQRALSRELDDDAVVVGTIDDRNRASLRTAQRAGRAVVASWWFLSPGA